MDQDQDSDVDQSESSNSSREEGLDSRLEKDDLVALKRQLDESHEKCRTDSKIVESIVAYHIKSLQREIEQLRGDQDELMENGEDDDADVLDDTGDAAPAENPTQPSQSPWTAWEDLQGGGGKLRSQITLCHEKCRADWKIDKIAISEETQSLRDELHKHIVGTHEDVADLKYIERSLIDRLTVVEHGQSLHKESFEGLQLLRQQALSLQAGGTSRAGREKRLREKVGNLEKKEEALRQEVQDLQRRLKSHDNKLNAVGEFVDFLHSALTDFFVDTTAQLGKDIPRTINDLVIPSINKLLTDRMWDLSLRIRELRGQSSSG